MGTRNIRIALGLVSGFLTALVWLLPLGCTHGKGIQMDANVEASQDSARVEALRSLLVSGHGRSLLPEFDVADPAALRATPMGQAALAWALTGDAATEMPATTYSRYRQFQATGDRQGYQKPYFDKRAFLTQAVIADWLEGSGARLERITDLIWSICEETTWVVPAHEGAPWHIDLFAAETAVDLALILHIMGDALPQEVRDRVQIEVKRRILDPYLEYATQYWWSFGRNNWTGVCAGSVGQTFLLMEADPERQTQAIATVMDQLGRFIEKGFEEDGGCLEGVGYWGYGLSQHVAFAEMLRSRTDGAIDLLVEDKIRAIAQYPGAVYLGHGRFATFSDATSTSDIYPFVTARIADRTGVETLRALAGDVPDWRTSTVLRNVLWDGARPAQPPALTDVLLPISGVVRLVKVIDGREWVLAAKAGSNAEPHNHNDVGSFLLSVDGEVVLCDPGRGLYTRQYFGKERYDNIFANSYGHSVPRIGGRLQPTGATFRGTLEKAEGQAVVIEMAKAYDAPDLKSLKRTLTLTDQGLEIADAFLFDGAGEEIEETLMTWNAVETSGHTATVRTEKSAFALTCDSGSLAVEELTEACKANQSSGLLRRITSTLPAAPERTVRFTCTAGTP